MKASVIHEFGDVDVHFPGRSNTRTEEDPFALMV